MGQELLTEVHLGSGRGRQGVAVDIDVQVVRSLTHDDLEHITQPGTAVLNPGPSIQNLRHSHHRLAEQIAKGLTLEEISLSTGYSPSYISTIKRSPAFADLVAYYESQKQTVFVDAMERLRVLGLDATEALQAKLDDPAVDWSKRELMELVELTLQPGAKAQGRAQGQAAQGQGASLSLEVKFVGARPRDDQVVEASFTEVAQNQRGGS